MAGNFGYKAGKAVKALEFEDYYVWDCSVIKSGGKYHMFSSRWKKELGFGWNWCFNSEIIHSVADTPDGEFRRLSDKPILDFENEDLHIEDPFFWYDDAKKKFCLVTKDDCKNGSTGITGEWGGGFYAESPNGMNFEIPENPTVYTRDVTWEDGRMTKQGNLERPSILFDENGKPTHLFCASGDGSNPYNFETSTFIVCMKLEEV